MSHKQQPKHITLYAKHITRLFDMPRSTQKVLGYLLDHMCDNNEVIVAAYSRTVMLEKLSMSPQTLKNALSSLTKNRILSSPGKGSYTVNPAIFSLKKRWGDQMNLRRKFQATIDYDGDRFTISGDWS